MLSEAFMYKIARIVIASTVADYLYVREAEKYTTQNVLIRSPFYISVKQGLILSLCMFYCGTVIAE